MQKVQHVMNRREFLGGLATAGVALGMPGAPARIIDTHVHFFDPTRPQGVPWPLPNSELYKTTLPRDLHDAVGSLNVAGVVVIEASAWLEDNQWILDLAKDHPIILGLMGHLDPGGPAFPDQLRRFAKDQRFRGIRLTEKTVATELHQPAFVNGLRQIEDADLAIDAQGFRKRLVDLVALSDLAPKLRIILEDPPFFSKPEIIDDPQNWSAFRELGRRPQVFGKVQDLLLRVNGQVQEDESFYRERLDQTWETFGGARLIYGSNWPVCTRVAPYAAAEKLVYSYFSAKGADAVAQYFWKNSAAVYRYEPGG